VRVSDAVAFLRALLDQAESTGRHGRAIPIRLLLALHADTAGEDPRDLLGPALDVAAREHYARTFLDEGPGLLALLRRVARSENSPARRHAVSSLHAATSDPSVPVAPDGRTALVEPLTGRQMEILRLLAEGRPNREIADALFVTEGTVKAHLHQIFGKLMVRTRTEAIRAARELDLVS